MTPLFFFSYARADLKNHLKIYDDLIEQVRSQRGGKTTDGIGFLDQEDIGVGAEWPEDLKNALRTCRVFVYLHSPTYYQSEWCGKEWHVFRQRVESYLRSQPRETARPSLMLPVLWVPSCKAPAHLGDFQFHHRGLGDTY